MRVVHAAPIAIALSAAACARVGMVDDGSSVAYGWAYAGSLRNGVQLPPEGDGYRVPRRWIRRGNQYGTDELVAMIQRVGRRVHRETGAVVGVADLSPRRGGRTPWHRSHQSGRDVDLLMFGVDRRGRPLPADAMVRYRADGSSRPVDSHGVRHSRRYFDAARNWALVRAIIEDPGVDVEFIYVYPPLEERLLAYARQAGEPPERIERAAALLQPPVDSSPHDDHFHVRIFCPASDLTYGCIDSAERPETRLWVAYARRALAALARAVAAAVEAATVAPI
ncbi:MAG: hypothetical protein D6689_07675 [Deltaproteobacteria bacterium]|nr:MAG: hypothetical protein D6689_07675 [Deltaproteobacteria bacterium]